jgi:putative transposase
MSRIKKVFNYGCQQELITPSQELKAILEYACGEANKLTNCAIYYCRQLYFKTGIIASKYDLHKLLKTNPHFQALYSHVSQQALTTVAESFKSFKGLKKAVAEGKVSQKPRLPNYRKKDGLSLLTFPKADVKLKGEMLRFPLGSKVKAWFGLDAFYLKMPTNLDYQSIKEIRILPRNDAFCVEYIYKFKVELPTLDSSKVLGIDPGITNWLACITNIGTSFLIDGRHLKSVNQWYNKQVARLKENQPQGFWSRKLARITEKRNRQMRDAVNKAARLVVNNCIDNQIGTIVFGWNKGQRKQCTLGKSTQSFVQIPTAKLKDRIAQLCEQYGIRFVETEESYTSKASFVDGDFLPTFGEQNKPEGWKPSGKRVNRGLYRTANNQYLNCDCQGAANIIRKVSTTLGICLQGVSSGALKTPLRVPLWTVQESPSLTNRSRSVSERETACGERV